jgi:hypothetical protein
MTHGAYGYGNNNPVKYSDPTGLCASDGNGREKRASLRKASEVSVVDCPPKNVVRSPGAAVGREPSRFRTANAGPAKAERPRR